MFFELPEEILREIYSFDSTYREIFNTILSEIEQYQIYKDYKNYYIYDCKSDILYSTDSLESPSWICSSFRISKEQMKDIVQRKKLTRSKHEKLQYDIHSFQFRPEANELLYL